MACSVRNLAAYPESTHQSAEGRVVRNHLEGTCTDVASRNPALQTPFLLLADRCYGQ